eukprot:6081270-Amphidinium_carterae.1
MIAAVTSSRFSDKFFSEWIVLKIPFRSFADLLFENLALVPENYQGMAMALHHAPHFWRDDLYISGRLVLGVHEIPTRNIEHGGSSLPNQLHEEQWRVEEPSSKWAVSFQAHAILGPAGSGKSTAVQVAVRQAVDQGARVVIACPTRMLVADLRQKFPDLDVDSIHAVFEIWKPEQYTLDGMCTFDLVVIEEVSQLSVHVFERLMRLWDAATRRPTLVFVGDFAQLKGVDPTQATDSPRWKDVAKFHLRTMRRCKCPDLRWRLELLRSAKPSKKQLADILRGHKAPSRLNRAEDVMAERPSQQDVHNIFAETPETTFVTISRAAAAWVNNAAVETLHPTRPLATLPADPDNNPDNYRGTAQVDHMPLPMHIYAGMRVTMTQNINKECDYVNGMSGIVLDVHRNGVRVQTDTGYIIMVFPWTEIADDEWGTKVTFYPIRYGYAHTLMKLQGATVPHLTMWLDAANVEAAAYVALSRVEYDRNWRFV